MFAARSCAFLCLADKRSHCGRGVIGRLENQPNFSPYTWQHWNESTPFGVSEKASPMRRVTSFHRLSAFVVKFIGDTLLLKKGNLTEKCS